MHVLQRAGTKVFALYPVKFEMNRQRPPLASNEIVP